MKKAFEGFSIKPTSNWNVLSACNCQGIINYNTLTEWLHVILYNLHVKAICITEALIQKMYIEKL